MEDSAFGSANSPEGVGGFQISHNVKGPFSRTTLAVNTINGVWYGREEPPHGPNNPTYEPTATGTTPPSHPDPTRPDQTRPDGMHRGDFSELGAVGGYALILFLCANN